MYVPSVTLKFVDFVHCEVGCDINIAQEIDDHFTFYAKDYKHMPKYRSGMWDGRIHLFDIRTRLLYVGLLNKLVTYCNENDIVVNIDKTMQAHKPVKLESSIESVVDTYDPPFTPYDYQYSSIEKALTNKRVLILNPTSSGKSFIIYAVSRYLQESGNQILVVVPTTSLVEQIVKDFVSYGWDVEDHCHKIYSGKSKSTDKEIIVSTWQSIYTMPEKWFSGFDAVLVDEAHTAKATCLKSIMEKCRYADYRIGLTGTLDESLTNEVTLVGLFGNIFEPTSTRELMDRGIISNLNINIVVLKHPDEECKIVSKFSYMNEIKAIVTNTRRTEYIAKLAAKQESNTLVLFTRLDHGQELFELIKQYSDSKHIYYIDGDTDVELREAIREKVETVDDAIVVASSGVFSTGINIKNLWNVIFTYPYKSRIKNLQSIGRSLRKMLDKDGAVLWDIVDDYSWKKKQNTTLRHAGERIKMYIEEDFDYKIFNINL